AAPAAPAVTAAPEPAPAEPATKPAPVRRSLLTPAVKLPPVAVTSQPEAQPAPSAPAVVTLTPGTLPPTPSRQDVLSALEPLRSAVQQCAGNLRGVAQLD